MFMHWLTAVVVLASLAACLYIQSYAPYMPQKWLRALRRAGWGALIGGPVGLGAVRLVVGPTQHGWQELPPGSELAYRVGLVVGAVLGASAMAMLGRLDWSEALRTGAAGAAPYVVGICIGAWVGGRLYEFLMIDAWHSPEPYRLGVQHKLGELYLLCALGIGGAFTLRYTARVRTKPLAIPPWDADFVYWGPLDMQLDLEPETDEAEVIA
jgi:uncharacterized protein YqgC (DUF456 family)